MEDIKVTREIRRRKILENSEKRLHKITNCRLQENDIKETQSCINNKGLTKKNKEIDCSKIKAVVSSSNASCFENEANFVNIPNETINSMTSNSSSKISINENNSIKIWKKLGFKLAVLAIIVRIVHIFKFGYLFGETVVIPFALFMMTQLGTCQFDQNISGITGPILFFLGLSPNKIKNLLICYNVIASILIYFGIYFFTFVLAHLTCITVLGI